MTFDHDPDQDRLVELFSSTDSGAGLSGSGVGSGKTLVAVRTVAERKPERLLIIAQPNIYRGWRDTVKAVTGRDLKFCGTQAKSGTSAKQAQQNMADAQAGVPGWYYVGREMFNLKNWRKRYPKRKDGSPIMVKGKPKVERIRLDIWKHWDMAIYDECQMLANPDSYSHKSFAHLDADFKFAQSADWFGSKLENMWSITNLLWPKFLAGQKQRAFVEEWLDTKYDHFAKWNLEVTGETWPGFYSSTLPAYAALPPAVEPPEPEKRYISLSRKERELYEALNEYMAAELDGDLLVTEMHTTLYLRLRELCLGEFRIDYATVIDEETGEPIQKQTIHFEAGDKSSTIDEIKSIMAEHPGEHFLVFTHSRKWAEKAAKDLGGKAYTGNQSISEKERLKDEFLAGDNRILVGTSAMSEGLDGLQHVCYNAILASRFSKSHEVNQALGRVARRGQKHAVNAWEIIREGTIDEGIVEKSVARVLQNNLAKSVEKKRLDAQRKSA